MKFVKDNNFENTFINLIEKWLIKDKKIDVLASGMVGARQGWIEAPYQKAPCNLNNIDYISPVLTDNRISLKIFSGISQNDPPDVMRGEETQIAGFLTNNNNFKGSICLPGTHSKWIKINKNSLEIFRTFMTGELFEIISKNSVLSHSMISDNLEKAEILNSANKIMNKPELFANALFQLRADDLINSKGAIIYRSRLSGYLLAMELIGSLEFWKNNDIVLIGNVDLIELYENVLIKKVYSIQKFNSEDMVLKGLQHFKDKLN
jgi:2-dehydro-3-deoxygalactonokinase